MYTEYHIHYLFSTTIFFFYSTGLVYSLYLNIRTFLHVKLFIILDNISKMFMALIFVVCLRNGSV